MIESLKLLKSKSSDSEILISGDIPCSGQIFPKPKVICQPKLIGKKIGKLAKIDNNLIKIKSEAKITKKEINYEVELNDQSSTVYSQGKFFLNKQYNISFLAGFRNLNHIGLLINKNLRGNILIKGRAKKSKKSNSISTNIKGKKLMLDGWAIEQINTKLNYKDGVLRQSFSGKGSLGKTNYNGTAYVNFSNSELNINLNLPYFTVDDIKKFYNDNWDPPLDISDLSAEGNASINLSGPFDKKKQIIQAKLKLRNGIFKQETFDEVNLELTSKNGFTEFQKLQVKKSDGVLNIQAKVGSSGVLSAKMDGENFLTEEIDFLKNSGIHIDSKLNFSGQVEGHLTYPRVRLEGNLSEITVKEHSNNSANFDINMQPDMLTASVNYNFGVFKAKLKYPTDIIRRTYFDFESNNWDFISFLESLLQRTTQYDFSSNLNSKIRLQIPKNRKELTSGSIQISDISIEKGLHTIKSQNPIKINLKNGSIAIPNSINLQGKNNYIEINPSYSKLKKS